MLENALIFIFKKIFSLLFMPFSVALSVIWVGTVCWWLRRGLKGARVLVSLGIILITICGLSVIANKVIKPLESSYSPLISAGDLTGVKWIVVLGGGQISGEGLPATLKLGNSSRARLIEGIRLLSEIPDSKILLSGGAVFDSVPVAETMAAAARLLGVKPDRIVLETASRDTAEQANMIRSIVKKDLFVLVTSAIHMPRSMMLFEQSGMNPIPAPSDYNGSEFSKTNPYQFFPRSGELVKIEAALHEYFGMLWAKAKQKF